MIKLDIWFIHTKSVELSEKYFDYWDLVLFFTEISVGSILLNKNGETIILMTEFVTLFCGLDVSFK